MALIETLQDDFQFGGIDSGKWTATNSQVVIGTNLDLEISSILAGNYISLTSTATYDLTGSSIFIQVTSVGLQSITSWEVYPIYLIKDANNKIFIRIAQGTVQPQKVVAGVTTNVGSGISYNSSTMGWFRIRESGGTTYFEYASDPNGTWTNPSGWNVANPITITALTVEVLCGTWQAESSTTTATFDNVNVIPGQYQFNWMGYTWNKRIHAGDPANNQNWTPSNVSSPDTNNYLTLSLTNPGSNNPFGCEIFSAQRGFGYGVYTAIIGTRLDNIPAPIGFGGMFTFDFTSPPDYREIDCDETRNYNGSLTKNILKNHAWNNGGNIAWVTNFINIPSDIVQTHRMIWKKGSIIFDSFIGAGTNGVNYFHAEHNTNIPTPGLERVHFNIFVDSTISGYQTVTPLNVVIQSFSFSPVITPPAIGYTDNRISYNPKSKYSWFLYNNGQLFADITGIAENRAFSITRNDSDKISFSASIDRLNALSQALGTNIASLFQAAITEVRVYRYGTPLVAGELSAWNSNVGGDRKLQLQAMGWLDLFKYRRTSDLYSGSQSGLTIAQALINTSLAKTNGSAGNYSGIVIGAVPSPDLSTVYTNQQYDQKTIYDALLEMANDSNGFDLEATWDKRINFYYPHIGVDRPDIVFTYPFGNVKDVQLSVDPTKLFNSLTARGKGSGVDQLLPSSSPLIDSNSQQKYGLREDVIDYSNISDQTLLTNVATADLNVYKQPLVIQKVIFDGSGQTNAPQVGTFHIGDLVHIYINNMGIYPNIAAAYIIDKIEVAINEADGEDVTLTLGNPTLAANGA